LYEESWIELTKQGYLARVKCIEIRVKMTELFMREYLYGKEIRKKNFKKNLYTGNPNKFRILQYLIHHHKNENHKILVFSDTLGSFS
jgi:DNA excision repair protein ERCC-3